MCLLRAATAAAARRAATSLPRSTGRSPTILSSSPAHSRRLLSSTPPEKPNANELYIYNMMTAVHAEARKEAQVIRESQKALQTSLDNTSVVLAKRASGAKKQVGVAATITVLALGGMILGGFYGVLQIAKTYEGIAVAEVQLSGKAGSTSGAGEIAKAAKEAAKAAKEAAKAAMEARDAAQAARDAAAVDDLKKSTSGGPSL